MTASAAPQPLTTGRTPSEESSTEILTVARCVKCGTHFKYVPDASWVTVVLPGMKSRLVVA